MGNVTFWIARSVKLAEKADCFSSKKAPCAGESLLQPVLGAPENKFIGFSAEIPLHISHA